MASSINSPLLNPPLLMENQSVQSWINSLPDALIQQRRPIKRRRISAPMADGRHSDSMFSLPVPPPRPNTPPFTDASLPVRPSTPETSRKRTRDNDADKNDEGDSNELEYEDATEAISQAEYEAHDNENTPKSRQLSSPKRFLPPPIHPHPNKSKKKKKKQTFATNTDSLRQLEKPLRLASLPPSSKALEFLPKDVHKLYDSLVDIENMVGIVPKSAHQHLEALGFKVYPHFLQSDDAADDAIDIADIQRIVRRAEDSALYKRHECGWNVHVHGPLLDLVFSSTLPRDYEGEPTDRVSARYEPVMAATIVGSWIPQYSNVPKETGVSFPCDVSVNNSETDSTRSSETGLTENISLSGVHSSRGSKKVDFVVVLDEAGPLHHAITQFVDYDSGRRGMLAHVNQTIYQPITRSPIAVSIETKLESSSAKADPLVQLGVWVGAWHKRLYAFRDLTTAVPRRLVTLPLIQVTGHDWKLWFACDYEDHIDVRGPITLGSTKDIMSTYAVVRSLQAIREWIETEFYAAMKEWFMVDHFSELKAAA